jgi:flagellar hook-basal body complex protein FliE
MIGLNGIQGTQFFDFASPAVKPPATPATAGADFGAVLQDLAMNTFNTLKSGEAAAIQGIDGKMPVQKVVEAVMEAEKSFQTAVAIRDKIVNAYLEISRMQI